MQAVLKLATKLTVATSMLEGSKEFAFMEKKVLGVETVKYAVVDVFIE